jgi:hypothetical protein
MLGYNCRSVTMQRKYALTLALIALAMALFGGLYLWFKAAMRVADMPEVVLSKEAAVEAKDQSSSRTPRSGCYDPIRRVDVPCAVSDPLVEAARLGDVPQMQRLLARRTTSEALNNALFAVSRAAPLVVDSVTFKEVKPDEKHGFRYAQIARLLLEKSANIEARDEGGETPLIAAANRGEDDVVKLLLDRGANIEAANGAGQTALIAAACNCPIVDMADTYDSVWVLLDNGANVEARDKQGRTALMAAAGWGRDRHVRLLLDRRASIDARDNDGNTALLIAASESAYPTADAAKLLLARGADVQARNENGDTALILAASKGGYEDGEIVEELLRRGADLQARNKQGYTALELARKNGRTKTTAILRSWQSKGH